MTITRYEIKFVVSHDQARRVMEAASTGLVPDTNGDNARYRVTSVYFDSLDLRAYWEKIDGVALRRKLRIRFYGVIEDPSDDRPFYLELKYRKNDSVYKDRMQITHELARKMFDDSSAISGLSELIDPNDKDGMAIASTIEHAAAAAPLIPTDTISYEREAWIGAVDSRLRLTFDRNIHAYPPEIYMNVDARSGLPLLPSDRCVMEIKFDQVIPRWLREIVVDQQLVPRRFSKYAYGLVALKTVPSRSQSDQWVTRSGVELELPTGSIETT